MTFIHGGGEKPKLSVVYEGKHLYIEMRPAQVALCCQEFAAYTAECVRKALAEKPFD